MDQQPDRYQSIKSILLDLVKVGVGSVVLASTLFSTPGPSPAPGDGADPTRLEERVRGVRDAYGVPAEGADRGDERRLVWINGGFRNAWINGGFRNGWGNWRNGGWGNFWRNVW
jgi:rSAM-associated Gly-rich repeat protein